MSALGGKPPPPLIALSNIEISTRQQRPEALWTTTAHQALIDLAGFYPDQTEVIATWREPGAGWVYLSRFSGDYEDDEGNPEDWSSLVLVRHRPLETDHPLTYNLVGSDWLTASPTADAVHQDILAWTDYVDHLVSCPDEWHDLVVPPPPVQASPPTPAPIPTSSVSSSTPSRTSRPVQPAIAHAAPPSPARSWLEALELAGQQSKL